MIALADYELEGEIGRGGMGRVYRARHVPTGVIRAVKLLEGAPDLEGLERFQREAQALARVAGRGVVPVHKVSVEQGRLFLAMDLLAGGSLRDLLKRQGALPWRSAAALVAKLARVLERCAAAGLVHRDVKPENVLLDEEGEPYLSDFGCVRDLGRSALTLSGVLYGTYAYMSPEQLEGERATPAADVYGLGVLLHELVAGERPYEESHPALILELARAGKRASLRAKGAPPELEDAIARALTPAARERITAAELARELEALTGAGPRKELPARRGLSAPAAAGFVGFVLAGVALVVFLRRTVGPESPGAPGEPPVPAVVSSAAATGVKPPLPAPPAGPGEGAKLALQRAARLLSPDSAVEAGDALEDFSPADFALWPEARRTFLDAGRRQIEDFSKREREPLHALQLGFPVAEVLGRVDPAVALPDAFVAVAAKVMADSALRRTAGKDLVLALIVYLPHAPAAELADRDTTRGWGRFVEGAINDGDCAPARLDRVSRILVDRVNTPYSHFVRGRVLAMGVAPRDASKIAPAEAEYELARRDKDDVAFLAASGLAGIEEKRHHWDEAARVLGEEWPHRDWTSVSAYRHYAFVLAQSHQWPRAVEVLREGAARLNAPYSEQYRKAAAAVAEALAQKDEESARQVVTALTKGEQ